MDQHYAHYGATCNVPHPIYYITPTPPPRRSKLRFIHAFLGALGLLWLTHHLFHRHHWHRHRHRDWDWDIHMDIEGLDHDADGCAVWDTYDSPSGHSHTLNTTSSTYTLAIPLSSERFHFASWGPIDKSTFEVVPVESDEAQVVVEVNVVKDVYNGARVCALPSRGERETYGVGIYSPRRDQPYPSEDWPAFSIKVFIPLTKHQQRLGSFETRLGQFEHTFPDLSTINFSRLSVAAANVPMVFKDVVADTISATNANGAIEGKLTGATEVSVKTANAPIEGEVTLTGSGAVRVSNANSPMTLAIQLKSGDFYPRPDYHLELTNAKAPISARIASQPLNSGFFLKASSVMGDTNVYLNAAFQGDFKLSNMFNPPIVELRNKQDPSGEGRERYLRFAKRGSTTTGSVQWGRGEHAPGNVDMSNVGGSIGLYLE
ncbi:putative transmembrane protein [Rhizoctonia solani 123E]|uniref:Putative transmembrane protein n=1 Tax=Rhizoctonia solani 123E TaxID=1423351 RepID=A0A074RNZ9_9AGAM|nr:putative transmembrane protein [Rhizoctonia solani 123E]